MPVFTNIEDFKLQLKRLKAELAGQRVDVLLKVANDVLALTKLRIQQTGIDSEGNPFEDYTNPYNKIRVKKGLQVNHVDFKDTGRMWNSIRSEVIENTPSRTVIEIKSRNQADQNKLNGQFKKRGNILIPTEEELNIGQETAEACVEQILNDLNV